MVVTFLCRFSCIRSFLMLFFTKFCNQWFLWLQFLRYCEVDNLQIKYRFWISMRIWAHSGKILFQVFMLKNSFIKKTAKVLTYTICDLGIYMRNFYMHRPKFKNGYTDWHDFFWLKLCRKTLISLLLLIQREYNLIILH